jgi:DNA polymerase bacteriophage-type
MPEIMSLDAESSAVVNLTTMGADVYTRDVSTRCLMLAYHNIYDPTPPKLWCEGDPVPQEICDHIKRGGLFSGWNVVFFDRLLYKRKLVTLWGFPEIPDENWVDSMHLAAAANLPRSLDGCARAVGVSFVADLKDKSRIIRITNANRTPIPVTIRELFTHPEKYKPELVEDMTWLANRCVQDVTMEESVLTRLPPWPGMNPWVSMPAVDRRVNDRGVMIDLPLVQGLVKAATIEATRMDGEINALTSGAVPKTTNIEGLKRWLVSRGVELTPTAVPNKGRGEDDADEEAEEDTTVKEKGRTSPWVLRKSDIADLMARTDIPEDCRLALGYRAEAAKASTGKLRTMAARAHPDDWRLRGTILLGGAQQTLRFSSQGIQAHNTLRDVFAGLDDIADTNGLDAKKNKAEVHRLSELALATAIEVGRTGDAELARALYEVMRKDAQGRFYRSGVVNWVARMVRRCITVPAGRLLLTADWAQVEARITVWLAQQLDVLNAFATGEDVYRITAAGIFKTTADRITKEMRQTGKVSILACGFGGGPFALVAMGYNLGLLMSHEEAVPIVKAFRESKKQIVDYWYATDDAAANAVDYPGFEFPVPPLGIVSYFKPVDQDVLCCKLPSGRLLRYWEPRLTQEYWDNGNPKPRRSLSALTVKGKAVFRRSLYHTILFENQVQAIGADMLCQALVNADREGLFASLHVHDSVSAESLAEQAARNAEILNSCMRDMPSWTSGLPIGVDVDISTRFG